MTEPMSTKVFAKLVHPENGYGYNIEQAKNLDQKKFYTVSNIEMGQSNTMIWLEGLPGSYNSVQFDFYDEGKSPIDIYEMPEFNQYLEPVRRTTPTEPTFNPCHNPEPHEFGSLPCCAGLIMKSEPTASLMTEESMLAIMQGYAFAVRQGDEELWDRYVDNMRNLIAQERQTAYTEGMRYMGEK